MTDRGSLLFCGGSISASFAAASQTSTLPYPPGPRTHEKTPRSSSIAAGVVVGDARTHNKGLNSPRFRL